MYFTQDMVQQAEERYGTPEIITLNYAIPRPEYEFLRATQKHRRSHDVTLYLYHEGQLAVMRKPVYPEGAFRPPSGGLKPGESVEEATAREATEELGVPLLLDRYLVRVRVNFICGAEAVFWTSHVFRAALREPGLPSLEPQDHEEIAEARWVTEEEFFGPVRQALLRMGSMGILYRAHLHDYVWRRFGWG
ncbi:MAG: NUDIX hydrolase [Candidatus Zixiibacteriota bacterium]|nr:MAG: NUDIX hydrolase [candidate division Zixibacteria bacterium]